jgi:hypothetical protein
VNLSLRQKEQLEMLFGANKELESAIGQFFREQAIYYNTKLVICMKSIPPQTEEAIQNAAVASQWENAMSAFKDWAKRQ